MSLRYVTSADDLERVLEESTSRPIWLLKHSDDCGLSQNAFAAFEEHARSSSVPHWVLVVQDVPAESRRLAALVDVRHESPQALYLSRRRALWNASHRAVTTAALGDAEARAVQSDAAGAATEAGDAHRV